MKSCTLSSFLWLVEFLQLQGIDMFCFCFGRSNLGKVCFSFIVLSWKVSSRARSFQFQKLYNYRCWLGSRCWLVRKVMESGIAGKSLVAPFELFDMRLALATWCHAFLCIHARGDKHTCIHACIKAVQCATLHYAMLLYLPFCSVRFHYTFHTRTCTLHNITILTSHCTLPHTRNTLLQLHIATVHIFTLRNMT